MLQIGSLTLDPATHLVNRAGKEIPLTAKEYALLEFLMRRARQIVTRIASLFAVVGKSGNGK